MTGVLPADGAIKVAALSAASAVAKIESVEVPDPAAHVAAASQVVSPTIVAPPAATPALIFNDDEIFEFCRIIKEQRDENFIESDDWEAEEAA